jgi:cysteine desulfurase
MKKRIYLDYASTTPLDKRVVKAMLPYFSDTFGNPSALSQEGVLAKKAVLEARTSVAKLLNIRSEEVIFTGSGTEADNLAILGVFNAFRSKFKPHIVTTTIEHPGILEACRHVEKEGGEVTYVAVEKNGIVDPQKIKAAIKPMTVLISVMLANNEIGTVQPLRDIRRMLDELKKEKGNLYPYLHTDASQAANYIDLNFQKHGVDLMTLDASKVYGPKGVGLLAVKKHVAIVPIGFGGGQERGLRSGTENVPGIIGFAKAMEIANGMRESESERLAKLRDHFFTQIEKTLPNVIINGDKEKRLPNNVNICIPGIDAEFAVIQLDSLGIAASAASACLNLSETSQSYVIEGLYKASGEQEKKCSGSSLRFTFGRETAQKHIDLTLRSLHSIIKRH